ncbi:hypothetical protein N1851_031051 [Merluccius polli]|uniref:Myb/SANT-like DNA-binding domain-containing protein n=1 Tax=Merluccius polli TaxID=89951 RepID=A0AA47M4F6_MERPO|nr:hypothetical protein N1851_031051 [Merluccius polli]
MTTETKRSTYFNVLELEVLMLAYGEYEHFGEVQHRRSSEGERDAREKIAARVNACNSTGEKRTWKQLKMKHKNIIQNANRKKAEARKTGGGPPPPPPPPLTEAEELALSQNRGRPVAEGIPGGSSSESVTPQDTIVDGVICLVQPPTETTVNPAAVSIPYSDLGLGIEDRGSSGTGTSFPILPESLQNLTFGS